MNHPESSFLGLSVFVDGFGYGIIANDVLCHEV